MAPWGKTLWQFRKLIFFFFFLSSTLNSNLKSYMVFGCKIEDNLHFIFSNSRFSSFGVVNPRCLFQVESMDLNQISCF